VKRAAARTHIPLRREIVVDIDSGHHTMDMPTIDIRLIRSQRLQDLSLSLLKIPGVNISQLDAEPAPAIPDIKVVSGAVVFQLI